MLIISGRSSSKRSEVLQVLIDYCGIFNCNGSFRTFPLQDCEGPCWYPEFPASLFIPSWRDCYPLILALQSIPNDLCWVCPLAPSPPYLSLPDPVFMEKSDRERKSWFLRFFVNIAQIPPVLRWLRYFSTLGYTLEALAINEVGSGLQIVVCLPHFLLVHLHLLPCFPLVNSPSDLYRSFPPSYHFQVNWGVGWRIG